VAGQPESGLTARFNLLGRDETRFSRWSIDSAYLVSTDGFSFELFSQTRADLFGLELQPVELIVGGASQLIGRIDATTIGDSGSTVTCEGRDYLADLVECNVDPGIKVSANTQIGDALLEAMAPCGIESVTDFENVLFSEIRAGKKIKRGKRTFRKRPLQEYKHKPGEGIFEYCNRLIARQGATIQPGQSRSEVVIDSPDYTQDALYTLRRTDDPVNSGANNIDSGQARRDFSSFPTYTLFTGTAGASGQQSGGLNKTFDIFELVASVPSLLSVVENKTVSGRWKGEAAAETKNGALYRLLYNRDSDARVQEDLDSGVRRAIADRLKDSLAYTCTVKGHGDPTTGAIYSINTMADVDDAITGVHERLWIAKRTLRYAEGEGAMTDLELWRPGSFIIEEGAFEALTSGAPKTPATPSGRKTATFTQDPQQFDPNTGRRIR
jgi:prophage tail gpP-like protein